MSLAQVGLHVPELGDHDNLAVLLVASLVLLTLMQDAVVVRLRHADELTVVTLGAHHAAVVKLVHGGPDAEAVAEVELLLLPHRLFDLHVAVDDDGPVGDVTKLVFKYARVFVPGRLISYKVNAQLEIIRLFIKMICNEKHSSLLYQRLEYRQMDGTRLYYFFPCVVINKKSLMQDSLYYCRRKRL